MTTKYASRLAEALAKSALAVKAARNATNMLNKAQGELLAAQSREKKWAEDWPNLAERKDRPLWQSPTDGMCVSADGSEAWIQDGPNRRRLNRPDIYASPAPGKKLLAKLAAAAVDADHVVQETTEALAEAKAAHKPTTVKGHVVVRNRKIQGMEYAAGDAIDIGLLDWRKAKQLIDHGIIRNIGVT